MIAKVKEVECSLDDFDDWDLKDELESRGYSIDRDIEDFDDWDLIDELQSRDYTVVKEGEVWVNDAVWELYQEWLTDEGDNNRFEKSLREFFSKLLDKNV
jgi:predicted AlkP superfamily phosphohydrolase/phosphomutase